LHILFAFRNSQLRMRFKQVAYRRPYPLCFGSRLPSGLYFPNLLVFPYMFPCFHGYFLSAAFPWDGPIFQNIQGATLIFF
jgi:hypothetical protein